jgi:PEP-CTERM motif
MAVPAQAAYVINLVQNGADVVATGSGSYNLTALTDSGEDVLTGGIFSGFTVLTFGPGTVKVYTGITGPANFGTGASFVARSSNTGPVGGLGGQPSVLVPVGYVSGTQLGISTSTWNNQTLASLGAVSGTYVWTWGNGGTADSLTLNVGAVPEPATWAMMIAGFGIVGCAMRRRVAKVSYA